jgi:hypothetical protein
LQRDALTEEGCAKIFTEQMSGAVTDRPALHDALEFARSGDTLIVCKLDRLARSMKQLIETVETLRVRGIGFRSLTEALDTTTAQGRVGVHMVWRAARIRAQPGPRAHPRLERMFVLCKTEHLEIYIEHDLDLDRTTTALIAAKLRKRRGPPPTEEELRAWAEEDARNEAEADGDSEIPF